MEARCRGGRLLFFPRFLFRGREAGVFFPEEGRSFPFASSKGCFEFLFLPSTKGSAHSCVPCGDPTFLCVPRREPGIFFPEEGREPIFQRDASKGFVFLSVRREANFFREGKISEVEGWPFPEPWFFPHPQEKLPNLKGANLFLVPADLLLIDDDSEIEPIHSFSFFMEGIQPFSCFIEGMEIGRDRGFRFFFLWKGWIPLNLLRGERRKET